MRNKIIKFIKSEDGGIVEWLIGALIIGVGSIPVILGLMESLNVVSQAGGETIKSMIQSGY